MPDQPDLEKGALEHLKVLLSRQQIESKVGELAVAIERDYQDKNPLLIGVLKGSFIFLADLVRALTLPLEIEFVRLSSYVGRDSSGRVEVVQDVRAPIESRHVLVVEDIVDTGLSLSFLLEHLRRKNPASLRLCALLDKPSRRRVPLSIDYLGFAIPDRFVVGYGLDYDEKFRHLPDICYLEENE